MLVIPIPISLLVIPSPIPPSKILEIQALIWYYYIWNSHFTYIAEGSLPHPFVKPYLLSKGLYSTLSLS